MFPGYSFDPPTLRPRDSNGSSSSSKTSKESSGKKNQVQRGTGVSQRTKTALRNLRAGGNNNNNNNNRARPPPGSDHSTLIPLEWRSKQSAIILLRGLESTTSTWDIYRSLCNYGNIVFIELDQASTSSQRSQTARVRFEPPPHSTAFFQQGRCRIESRPISLAWVEFLKQGDDVRRIRSPVGNFYPETTVLSLSSLAFGLLLGPDNVMIKRKLESPTRSPMPSTLNVDLKRKKFIMSFSVSTRDNNSTAPMSLQHYRADIKFNNVKDVYLINTPSGTPSLVITVKGPPVFWRKRRAVDRSFDLDRPVWGERELWQRSVEIRDQSGLTEGPVSLEEDYQFIDIGRWTTYWLHFHAISAELPATLGTYLKDWNIKFTERTPPEQTPDTKPKIWALLNGTDAPSWPGDASSWGHDLALLDTQSPVQLPFDVRYQLEVCISHDILCEYSIDKAFLMKLGELSRELVMGLSRARLVLEYAADRGQRIHKPMDLFEDRGAMEYFSIAAGLPDHCVMMRKVIVTPTKIFFNTPTVEMTNRVIRHYKEVQEYFLRIQFTDELLEGRITGSEVDKNDQIYQRAFRVLNNGIKMGAIRWQFLAFGNSQFRENGAFLFHQPNGADGITCDEIRRWMGRFSHITVVAKYAARLGQCLSTTRPVLAISAPKIVKISDISRGKFCFTDGVGKISPFLADMVAQDWRVFPPPSAIQFRMGGCKGVLVSWPEAKGHEVHIRKSQEKFLAEFNGLEVIRCSQSASATLNRQTITILSCLGVPDEVFVDMMIEQLKNYDEAMADPSKAAQLLARYIDENQMTKTIEEMVVNCFMELREPFVCTLLQLWRSWSIKSLKEKARLVVEKGAVVLGGSDETGTLRGYSSTIEGKKEIKREQLAQIFLQITDPGSETGHRVITGLCVVGRNPSLHPGDIRVVEAVDVPALRHVKDVVLFPTTGDRDVPSMCSGGDLDGDDFFVIWNERLLPKEWGHPPMDHSPPPPVEEKNGPTAQSLMAFFVLFMKNNTLPLIALAHLGAADCEEGGAKSERCLQLAELHSMAVDYVKTGVPAEWSKKLEPRKWPHFMEKNRRFTYHSESALGKLFDIASKERDVFDVTDGYKLPFDQRILKRYKLDSDMLKAARRLKTRYDIAMRRIMGQLEIKTEFELWTSFVLSKPRVGSSYKVQEKVGQESYALKKQFRELCIQAAGGSRDIGTLGPFVAAMYQVTWEEVRIALHQSRQPHVRPDGTIRFRQLSARSMPLISFPWLFDGVLGEIAGGTAAQSKAVRLGNHGHGLRVRATTQTQIPTEAVAGASGMSTGIDDAVEDCVITDAGQIVHRGEILHLFHHEDDEVGPQLEDAPEDDEASLDPDEPATKPASQADVEVSAVPLARSAAPEVTPSKQGVTEGDLLGLGESTSRTTSEYLNDLAQIQPEKGLSSVSGRVTDGANPSLPSWVPPNSGKHAAAISEQATNTWASPCSTIFSDCAPELDVRRTPTPSISSPLAHFASLEPRGSPNLESPAKSAEEASRVTSSTVTAGATATATTTAVTSIRGIQALRGRLKAISKQAAQEIPVFTEDEAAAIRQAFDGNVKGKENESTQETNASSLSHDPADSESEAESVEYEEVSLEIEETAWEKAIRRFG